MASPAKRTEVREKLRAVGKWEAFSDACRRHRAGGLNFDQAWAESEKEFAADLPADKPPPVVEVAAASVERKELNERDAIRWVFENLAGYELGTVTVNDAPSGGAWGLLVWVKANKANESDFYRNIWPKTVPARSKLDDESASYGDDGREQLKILERLLGAAKDDVVSRHGPQGPA